MIPTMIISFLLVGAMFFLTANEAPKNHHKIKEPIVLETKKAVKVVSQKEKSIKVVKSQIVEEEVIVVAKTPKISSEVEKSKKSVISSVEKVEKTVLSQNDKPTKEENPISKIETTQKETILPQIPTVPKVKSYEIKIPVPEKSVTPVRVTESIK